MKYELELNPKPFRAIKAGIKTIEVRASTTHNKHLPEELKSGDVISFLECETGEKIDVYVVEIRHYKNVRSLLETEGIDRILSGLGGLEQGIENIESISGYKEAIARGGIYAIEVKLKKK